MTDADLSQKARMLHAYRALVENPAWKEEIAPMLAKAVGEHRDGCTARGKTPMERAEHVEAFHLAVKLDGYCAKQMKALQGAFRVEGEESD